MWSLIRLTFLRRRGQQERAIERVFQTKSSSDVAPQVHGHNLIVDGFTVWSNPSAIGGKSEINNAVCDSKGGGILVKNEGCVRNVGNRNHNPFLGARVGVVCHGGSNRYWEWDDKKGDFIAFVL